MNRLLSVVMVKRVSLLQKIGGKGDMAFKPRIQYSIEETGTPCLMKTIFTGLRGAGFHLVFLPLPRNTGAVYANASRTHSRLL